MNIACGLPGRSPSFKIQLPAGQSHRRTSDGQAVAQRLHVLKAFGVAKAGLETVARHVVREALLRDFVRANDLGSGGFQMPVPVPVYFISIIGWILIFGAAAPTAGPFLPPRESIQLASLQGAVEAPAGTSESPWGIARIINDNKKLSETRHESKEIDLRPFWRDLGIPAGAFENCPGNCSAEVYQTKLDGESGSELILKLTRSATFCRFLIASKIPGTAGGKSGWISRGYVDHDFNRYQMARHRVAHFDRRAWLVVWGQAGSGSGFSLYGETWYQVGPAEARPVLWYPVEGHTYPWPAGVSREFTARPETSDRSKIILHYKVNYAALNPPNRDRNIAVNFHRACYTWDRVQLKFRFSDLCSDISEQEVAAIANLETEEEEIAPEQRIGGTTFYSASQTSLFVGGGYDVFLKYNFSKLGRIANDRNNNLREWLRLVLADCDDTAQKKELLSALNKK